MNRLFALPSEFLYYFKSNPRLLILAALIIPPAYIIYLSATAAPRRPPKQTNEKPLKTMQAPAVNLAPPKDDPYTLESLKEFDGNDESKPIYVSIKGTVFDVTHKRDTYGPGKSYGIFAGKDASRGLGLSSLKPHDAVPDYSTLEEKDMKVLDDWHGFFSKRYNIVGRVTDHPVNKL